MKHRPAPSSSPLLHDGRAQARARQALRCLPFRRGFYERVAKEPLSSSSFCRLPEAAELCRGPLSSRRVEDHWVWLIRLGVLRREVDGQGLTERVRLTPMGRELLRRWPGEIPPASGLDQLFHQLRRSRPRL